MSSASREHQTLANFLKEVHLSLRKSSTKIGAEKAWDNHCKNKNVLEKYAECMQKLATNHWQGNFSNESKEATSRIQWVVDICMDYFINESYMQHRIKEFEISKKINKTIDLEECFSNPIKLIDVGSCYNPFKEITFLDVLAIDLHPANKFVLQCDFLSVSVGTRFIENNAKVVQLQESSFDAVTFCFVLEYIPSSDLRINACIKAYKILKPGGLLIINTPDSKHVGANSKLMKCWQYTLSCIGFIRIKYEKFKHMHCMAFRKALCKPVAIRWTQVNNKPYMSYAINIPQDFQTQRYDIEEAQSVKIEVSLEEFKELPFSEI